MLRLYLDHNIQRQIASGLRLRGIDVTVAYEDGWHEVDDPTILKRAKELNCAFVTKDSDFLAIAQELLSHQLSFPGIIYITDELTPIGQCVSELELVAQVYEPHEILGTVLYLPLR